MPSENGFNIDFESSDFEDEIEKIELGIYRRRLWLEREKSDFKIYLSDRLLENRGHLKSVFEENFAFVKLHSILDDLKQPKFSQNWFFW